VMMMIGTLALTGFPLTAGFYSKDAIIESVYAAHNGPVSYAFILLIVAAGLTSFYSWRLFFMTFMGQKRWGADAHHGHHDDHHHTKSHDHDHGHDHHHEPHESPSVMLIPLFFLAIGALIAGLLFHDAFLSHGYEHFFKASITLSPDNHILHDMHGVPRWVQWSPFVMMVLGFVVAWIFYIAKPHLPHALAQNQPLLYQFLLNKWYFDEIYDFLFVRPAKAIGTFLWKKGDGATIDGLGPDGVSARVVDFSGVVVRLQTGYLYHYAFAMLIGLAAVITWYIFGGAQS
jgi:NADH-quinone oxidoreductase subunit L